MKSEKKAAVIGVYGVGSEFTTGQAVKCYEIINWLKEQYGSNEILVVNTYKWKRNPFKLLRELVQAFVRCENVLIMPATHGVKVFAPLSCCLKKLFSKRVHYLVIGGWLAEMLEAKKYLKNCVATFDGVYVETHEMVDKLQRLHLDNVVYMPNCRKLCNTHSSKPEYWKKPVRVCIYSRIIKEKGIEDAVEIVRKANEIMGEEVFHLDFYGKIGEAFREAFRELLKKNKDIVKYCGVKNADEGAETLAPYFALLFPTYYEGEGVAGTVLDAFAAATPVIANDWKYIRETVIDQVNGFVYPFRNTAAAAEVLCTLYKKPELYQKVQKECGISAERYSTDVVMTEFVRKAFHA